MGGCIARLLITDTSDGELWRTMGSKPEERESLVCKPLENVERVILIGVPLRGSNLVENILGALASSLCRVDGVNSVVTLSPHSRFHTSAESNSCHIECRFPFHCRRSQTQSAENRRHG